MQLAVLDADGYTGLRDTVPFNSVRQSRVTGPSKMLKYYVSHGNFCKMPNAFGDYFPNMENFRRLRRQTAENLDMSRHVWEVAETKISSDVSRVTWGAELN